MGFLSAIFGTNGFMATSMSGFEFIIGFFILSFFVLYLFGSGISSENIVFFVLSFFLLVISYGLFAINIKIITMIIIFIGLFVAGYVYNYFNKTD